MTDTDARAHYRLVRSLHAADPNAARPCIDPACGNMIDPRSARVANVLDARAQVVRLPLRWYCTSCHDEMRPLRDWIRAAHKRADARTAFDAATLAELTGCATCGAQPVDLFDDGSPRYPRSCDHEPVRE